VNPDPDPALKMNADPDFRYGVRDNYSVVNDVNGRG
jgi:hypothetical protein